MEVKGTLKYRKVQRTTQTGEKAGKTKWYATSVTDSGADDFAKLHSIAETAMKN